MTGPFPTYNLGHLSNQTSHCTKPTGGVRVRMQPPSGTIPGPAFSSHAPEATCGPGGNMCPGQGLSQGDADQASSSPAWTQDPFPNAHTSPGTGKRKEDRTFFGKVWHPRDFPGSPVVRTLRFHCRAMGLIPGRGTKIPQATWCGPKKIKVWHPLPTCVHPGGNVLEQRPEGHLLPVYCVDKISLYLQSGPWGSAAVQQIMTFLKQPRPASPDLQAAMWHLRAHNPEGAREEQLAAHVRRHGLHVG